MARRLLPALLLLLAAAACDRVNVPAVGTAAAASRDESLDSLRARAARQDSELVAFRRRAEESALLAAQSRELSEIVAEIDREVARVRLNVSDVKTDAGCEGAAACTRAQGERVRDRVKLLVTRVRRAEARMRQASSRLASLTREDSLQRSQIDDLQATIASLQQITERQQQELARANAELARLAGENATLASANASLRRAQDSVAAVADSVFFIAAPKETLLRLGVVEERGGSRLAFGRGKTLVPVAQPPRSAFRALSRARDTVIALPNGKRWYALVSAHPRALLHGATTRENLIAHQLEIRSPGEFWASGRYLILEEK